MIPLARATVAVVCLCLCAAGPAEASLCVRADGSRLRDVQWRHMHPAHPFVGQVFKGGWPISVERGACTRSPLQQLIVEVWDIIREGGVVLLGEVHDNPEHHAVRGDILWPRLEPALITENARPAAVFEHIRANQQQQLDAFYRDAKRGRRAWGAPALLKELRWRDTGWPQAETFYPLFAAALLAKLPIYPGNAVRERMRALVRDPLNADAAEEARLNLARAMPRPLVEALAAELAGSHCGILPAGAFEPMSLAQRYTDAHLADMLVKAADKHGGAFLLAGNGHVRVDRGVPWYVRQLAPNRKVASVTLREVEAGKTKAADYFQSGTSEGVATDYILFTPRHLRPDPCQNMRQNKQ